MRTYDLSDSIGFYFHMFISGYHLAISDFFIAKEKNMKIENNVIKEYLNCSGKCIS